MPTSNIKPGHFYSCPKEKTNFNWFAFELACEINVAIPKELREYLETDHGGQEGAGAF